MATIDEIEMVIDYLNAAYPAIPTAAETVAVFAEGLIDIPVLALLAAIREHVRESERFPTVAAIRRLAYRHMQPAEVINVIEPFHVFAVPDTRPALTESAGEPAPNGRRVEAMPL